MVARAQTATLDAILSTIVDSGRAIIVIDIEVGEII